MMRGIFQGVLRLLSLLLVWQGVNASMVKNLQNYSGLDRAEIVQNIQYLFQNTQNDEGRLSVVLLASAQVGEEKVYRETLLPLKKSLSEIPMEKNSYRAWRLGRLLLSADSIQDEATVKSALGELKSLLQDKNTQSDMFSAWAWGYLGGLNQETYQFSKEPMLAAAKNLSLSPLTDAIWAWVMAAQASANAGDIRTFHFILDQIKSITHQNSISLALSTGLQRSMTNNSDYPAWAMGIIELAAATLHDEKVYRELEKPLENSLQGAKEMMRVSDEKVKYGVTAEWTLAKLDLLLAKIRFEK